MTTIVFSKTLPKVSGGVYDRDSSFILGRRAFFNNNHKTHNINNVNKQIDYSKVNKESSNIFAKPLQNTDSNLRIQRLRLSTIGSGTSKLKSNENKISFIKDGPDYNYINNTLAKVRGSGGYRPKR